MTDNIASSGTTGVAFTDLFTEIALGARRAKVPPGTVLYEPDDVAEHVHFIHTGQVRIYQIGPQGTDRLIEILGPGEWFGVEALARSEKYATRAIAVEASEISQITPDQLLPALTRKPEALLELSRQLAGKVQTAREEAADLIFQDCNNRLIQTLLRFSDSAAASPSQEGVVLRITHHQLAQAVGVARETVSLALTQLRHKKLLRTGRNQLTFDPKVLRQVKCGGTVEASIS